MHFSAILLVGCAAFCSATEEPFLDGEFVFDPEAKSHGHVHASCIVECPNGDLLAVWYENGDPLPPPYFSDQRDKSDDVRIGGARKPSGSSAWEKPFVMADTFGVSDNNPCMVIDADQRLWLVYATLTGVPKWTWGSALLRYSISSDYQKPGPPSWDMQDVLLPHPIRLQEVVQNAVEEAAARLDWSQEQKAEMLAEIEKRFEQPLTERFGWMPRAHPLVRSDGAVILPLSNENFGVPAMAITTDGGKTWTYSNPVPGISITQPTLVELPDGLIVAHFRNSGPERRIKRSESRDGGVTWSPPALTDLPNPGAGIEALLLRDQSLLMVYNDKEDSPRDRLAVSISEDQGRTWKWTRYLENTPGERFDYPSIIQAQDGALHATYTYNLKTIKHVRFNAAWVRQGNPE